MGQAVRAIYEHGHLRLLDPVNLVERQEIGMTILSQGERAQLALVGILIQYNPSGLNLLEILRRCSSKRNR